MDVKYMVTCLKGQYINYIHLPKGLYL